MNSRIAQIIASSVGEGGKIDKPKLYEQLSINPESPEAFFVDALIGYEDGIRRLDVAAKKASEASAAGNSALAAKIEAALAEHKAALEADAKQRSRWLTVAVTVPIAVCLLLMWAYWFFLLRGR